MDTGTKIKNFIIEMSCVLSVAPPSVKNDSSVFRTETQIAAYADDVLWLPDRPAFTPELCFAIAHEMRHIWQIKTYGETYFEDYKEAGSVSPVEYNMQPAEIDANAFAGLMMMEFFGIEPLYDGVDPGVVGEIRRQMDVIRRNFARSV